MDEQQFFNKLKIYFRDVKLNSSSISAAFNKNKVIKQQCQEFVNEHNEYLTICNLVIATLTNFKFKKCVVCGRNINYRSSKKDDALFCSKKCATTPLGKRILYEKISNGVLSKYGVKNISSLDSIKAKKKETYNKNFDTDDKVETIVKKRMQTNLKRYGRKHYVQTKEYIEKTKKTNNEKYGVDFPQQNKEIRNKTINALEEKYGVDNCRKIEGINEKIEQTCIERYNASNPFKSDFIKNKVKQTCIEKYGVDNVFSVNGIKNKIKKTCIEKYGVENYSQSNESKKNQREKLWNNILIKMGDSVELISSKEEYINESKIVIKCKNCGKISEFRSIPQRLICAYCTRTKAEVEIQDFINALGLNILHNKRTIVKNYELDIFIPHKNIAIEFDGLYWHSDANILNKKYHLEKLNACKNNNIRLINIFEDEWYCKRKIVKSRIKAILGLTPYKIQARKCLVKEIDSKLANKFIEKYHIQGSSKSSVNLGLFYKDRLCAVMTFSKSRFNKKYDWELLRYCTLSNFNVIGGAGKLLSYFRKNYSGSIITYADKRWSDGNLYKQLGFKELKDSPPAYWYVYGNRRFNRIEFQKHKLKNKLKKFDPMLTEIENMKVNGYNLLWDCGNKVFYID